MSNDTFVLFNFYYSIFGLFLWYFTLLLLNIHFSLLPSVYQALASSCPAQSQWMNFDLGLLICGTTPSFLTCKKGPKMASRWETLKFQVLFSSSFQVLNTLIRKVKIMVTSSLMSPWFGCIFCQIWIFPGLYSILDVLWCFRFMVRRQDGRTLWSGWGAHFLGHLPSRTRPSCSTCLPQVLIPAALDSPWRRDLTRRLHPAPWNLIRW